MEYAQKREIAIKEAIDAGYAALNALADAEKHVNTARGFGIWDMLGGGMISSAIKHSKMNDAQQSLNEAQFALQRFSRELEEVEMNTHTEIKFEGIVQFLDIFCDNIFVDIWVQSKIKQTLKSIEEAKQRIQAVIGQLKEML
ncbi:MAG: hypothetical protein PUB22_06195 [Clostridiales bacterium]|nr:hypothetical protein [Clostridiales bacterium]